MDWHQIWEIASAPDNVPIVALALFIPFYLWYALKQGIENDQTDRHPRIRRPG